MLFGASPTVKSWEAQALSAQARQLTPQAYERGCECGCGALSSAVAFCLTIAARGRAQPSPTGPAEPSPARPNRLTRPKRRAPARTPCAHRPTAACRPPRRSCRPAPRRSPRARRASPTAGPVYETQRDRRSRPLPAARARRPGQRGHRRQRRRDRAAENPQLLVPGSLARYVNGLAAAPMSAPAAVQEIIWAGNQIIGLPYIFGGGHASFISPGYDCSGTVSFALHGANLLATPEDSSEFDSLGVARRRALGDDLRQPRPRLHGRRRAATGHERRRRSLEPAGAALAPAAPGQRRLRRAPPARAVAPSSPGRQSRYARANQRANRYRRIRWPV